MHVTHIVSVSTIALQFSSVETLDAERCLSMMENISIAPRGKTLLRSRTGTAISEFAPGLFLLLMFGLFPIVDAVCIGIDYGSARYLNELQLREAQKLPRSKAIDMNGSVISGIPDAWRHTLLGGLSATDQKVVTKIEYVPVPWQPVGSNQTVNFWFVNIATTTTFRPPLPIFLFNGVPGLGGPITFSVVGRRPVENNRFLNE